MINHTNLEDYHDPVLFDLENNTFDPDGSFYLDLAQQVGGEVLELGCGTGRVTIPLAEQGVNITGLDIVPEMLTLARRKAANLSIDWVEADVRNFQLGKQFNLICAPGCVFEHLLARTEQEAMLNCVREHLTADGMFVVATRFPHLKAMVNTEEEQDWFAYMDDSGKEIRVSGTDFYDPIRQVRHETAYRRWNDGDGEEVTKRARLALRFVFPQEMEALLHYNGFSVLHRYGDWDSSPLTNESSQIIYVCRKIRTD